MDKSILKNFAIYARNKLIQEIKNKASMLGITEKGIEPPLVESTADMLIFYIKAIEPYKISGKEVNQYKRLVDELNKRKENGDYATAYNGLIEEVAYTWFNRLIAIRFMEVNDYLPDKMRVLSSGRPGVNEPEFVTNYLDTSLKFKDEESDYLYQWKIDGSSQSMDKMFRLLFIKQCNALNKNLPELFEETNDYAELLLTISYNDIDGVLYKLVHDIPEEYFDIDKGNGQVEIIGWLYQYYNTERKDEVINIIGKNIVKKQDIPAATQLFTTDWVVRYMVDNSLGKYWLERNPNSSIRASLEYLMPGEIPIIDENISPKEIKVFDNAMGSGHCLSYAFDLLLMIYKSEGYTEKEAAKLIVENNLYGLDIDKRAYQLAYFAIMMKARQYNRNALSGELKANLYAFEDSARINKEHLNYFGLSMDKEKKKKAIAQINYLLEEFDNATEIGSILMVKDLDKGLISEFINDTANGQIIIEDANMETTKKQLSKLAETADMLRQKYTVMVTNPPYLNKFSAKLKKYIWENYNDYKGDLFSVFIYHNLELCIPNGYSAYMSPFVWMFIKTYEKLRKYIIKTKHISSLIQMEYSAFEEATVPICTFVLQNRISKEKGNYIKLSDFTGGMEVQRIKTLEAIKNWECGYYYEKEQDNFEKIPGMPIAYWVSENLISIFSNRLLYDYTISDGQNKTGNNEKYVRFFWEVFNENIGKGKKWFFYAKGGGYRKWIGNLINVVDWSDSARQFYKMDHVCRIIPEYLWYEKGITWGLVTSSLPSFRVLPEYATFDVGGSSVFFKEYHNYNYFLGLLNSKVFLTVVEIMNPTLNFQIKDIRSMPIIINDELTVNGLMEKIICISKTDWYSFETSWNFESHPILDSGKQKKEPNTIEQAYKAWKDFANSQFTQLKANEEELNRIFIEIYGLEDELTPEVSDKDITITKIFDTKEEIYEDIKGNRYILTKEDIIKSFVSYGVGCIFGRYSLDIEGLAFAGGEFKDKYRFENGEWEVNKNGDWIKSSIDITKDNIIIITDEDYFEDDIVNRFIEFVKIAFGEESLNENLKFIADELGGRDTPKEVIRDYFLKDFFNDHKKIYKNRPIYWLYDSGKENGFKALIYMHRYNKDTTGKLRVDYLHEVQKTYEIIIDNLKYNIANNKNPREVAKLEKRLFKITKQLKECKDYDERIAHIALARIPIDLDDGVKVNYDKVQTDEKGKNLQILAKI